MYTDQSGGFGAAVPPIVASGAVTVLPATGADTITTLAGTVAIGLATWGALYMYRHLRS